MPCSEQENRAAMGGKSHALLSDVSLTTGSVGSIYPAALWFRCRETAACWLAGVYAAGVPLPCSIALFYCMVGGGIGGCGVSDFTVFGIAVLCAVGFRLEVAAFCLRRVSSGLEMPSTESALPSRCSTRFKNSIAFTRYRVYPRQPTHARGRVSLGGCIFLWLFEREGQRKTHRGVLQAKTSVVVQRRIPMSFCRDIDRGRDAVIFRASVR